MSEVDEIVKLRCMNKPVKYISKKLGIPRDRIERIITENIQATDPFINDLVKGRKIENFNVVNMIDIGINDFSCKTAAEILHNERVLDYIALKMKDHHDRMMDCIRYVIVKYLKDCRN
ncbi:MAG: hypothetical protein ACP5UV_00960 [Thermoplasmata archaeon]